MEVEKKLFITGSAGQIEVAWQATERSDIGLIVCHPHPLFQGSMDNKVVTTIARAAASLGLPTLRFNFRGVGRSAGQHDYGVGEQQDVLTVMHYAQTQFGWQKVILAGFSFGAGMACLAACAAPENIAGLFLIAPPVHHFDAPNQLPYDFETWIYLGDADEVVPVDEMLNWAERVVPTPHLEVLSGAGHFFHGRLGELKTLFLQDLEGIV